MELALILLAVIYKPANIYSSSESPHLPEPSSLPALGCKTHKAALLLV